MLPTPHPISRYSELHQELLRLEVRRDRLAATCQPDASAIGRITARLRLAAMARIMAPFARTSPMPPASDMRDPLIRGAM